MPTVTIKVTWKQKAAAIQYLEQDGRIDPDDLIAAARDENHPCHGDFTWDETEAAEKQWRTEARKLIRAVGFQVKVEDDKEVGVRVAQYVSSPDPEEAVFVSLPKMRAKGKVSVVVSKEVTALHGHAARVYGIALAKVGLVGEEVVNQLQSIRDQVALLKDQLDGK